MGKQSVGFIGLGNMGAPMVERLLAHQVAVHVWARNAEKLPSWEKSGALVATSPRALGSACDVVIICVTDTAAVEDVVFGNAGIAESSNATILIDHSTIHPIKTQQFAERLSHLNGMRWLDIPVSGGPAGAREGSLIGMAGGDQDTLSNLQPILSTYTKQITRMGGVGAGQATKVVNQMLIGGNIAVLAEALNYADNFGVNAAQIPDALAGGWADSKVLQVHGRRMTNADYSTEADARIMLKDVDIALDMGGKTISRMPVTSLVRRLYNKLIESGNADKGQSGIMWLYKQKPL